MAMFDTAHNRLSYSELLKPDVGYHLEFAVGLTYSLDLEALLGVPVSLGLLDEMDSDMMKSPFYLLEAIRKCSDQIAIFCNAGSISLPTKIQSVYSLLENSVFEVKLPNRQNFHPKVWVIKYANKSGDTFIKLLVLSRNLTFDTSIDLCVALRGEISNVNNEQNQPLVDLLKFVMPHADRSKRKLIESLEEDLLKVSSFEIIHPFESVSFLPIGIPGYRKAQTELFNPKYDLFVVSPFLSDDVIKEISGGCDRKVLVTRKHSITPAVMESFDSVYVTKDLLVSNEFGVKQDIHAKLYFTKTSNGNYLYMGSANASHNAFNNNVEFLVKFKYKINCMGFRTFFKEFFPEDNCPYERIEILPEAASVDEADKLVSEAIKEAIYAIKFAVISQNGDAFNVTITSKDLNTKEQIKISPLHRQDLFVPLANEVKFSTMLLKELSEFYVLSVREKKVVIKVKSKGIPEDRDDAIYKSIIDSKAKFLSYISFILSDDYSMSAFEAYDASRLVGNNRNMSSNQAVSSAVYEKMLKLIHEAPERFNEVADLIKRLDPEVIGPEFMEIYREFEKAVRRIRR